jgi:hypothetical protein
MPYKGSSDTQKQCRMAYVKLNWGKEVNLFYEDIL